MMNYQNKIISFYLTCRSLYRLALVQNVEFLHWKAGLDNNLTTLNELLETTLPPFNSQLCVFLVLITLITILNEDCLFA